MKKKMIQCLAFGAVVLSATFASAESSTTPDPNRRGMFGSSVQRTVPDLNSELNSAAKMVREMLVKHPEVARSLTSKAACVAIFPNITKVALGVGAEYGRGILTCKTAQNEWSSPSFTKLTGGSIGAQLGVKSTDVMMFVIGAHAMQKVANNEFVLGSDLAVTAGSLDKNAVFDFREGAYAFSKSDGLFVGASLDGAHVATDREANATYYGKEYSSSDILSGREVANSSPTIDELRSALKM